MKTDESASAVASDIALFAEPGPVEVSALLAYQHAGTIGPTCACRTRAHPPCVPLNGGRIIVTHRRISVKRIPEGANVA
jgi:hypothetical protein